MMPAYFESGELMIRAYRQTLGSFSRDVRLGLTIAALIGLGSTGVFSVLFNLYLLRLGFGPKFIGLVSAVAAITRAASCLLAGSAGMRWGTRRPMLVGISLAILSLAALPFNEQLRGPWQAGWIVVAYCLSCIGLSVHMVFFTPFLACATSLTGRSYAFSLNAALGPLAAFAGSLLGGFLPSFWARLLNHSAQGVVPYRYAMALIPALLLPAFFLLRAVHDVADTTAVVTSRSKGRAPYGAMALLTLVMLLRWAGRGPTTTFFNVYLDDALHTSTALIGALSAAGNLVTVPGALLMPTLLARWGAFRTLLWCTVGMAVSILPLALVPHWMSAGLGYVLTSALFGITSPAITVFSQEMVSDAWRPAMAGVMNMSVGLGSAIMAFGGGYAIATLGYRTLFLVSAFSMAMGAIVFWACFRVPRGEMAKRG